MDARDDFESLSEAAVARGRDVRAELNNEVTEEWLAGVDRRLVELDRRLAHVEKGADEVPSHALSFHADALAELEQRLRLAARIVGLPVGGRTLELIAHLLEQ